MHQKHSVLSFCLLFLAGCQNQVAFNTSDQYPLRSAQPIEQSLMEDLVRTTRASASLSIRLGKLNPSSVNEAGFQVKYVPYATQTLSIRLKQAKGPSQPVLDTFGKPIPDVQVTITDEMRQTGKYTHFIEDLPAEVPIFVLVEASMGGKAVARLEQEIKVAARSAVGGNEQLQLRLIGLETYLDPLSLTRQNPDIPADPETLPPALQEQEIATSVSVTEDPDKAGRFIINMGGILHPNTRQPVDVKEKDVSLVEDETTKGFKFSDLGNTVLPIDLVLVIDNTSSMREEIDGVKESLAAFINDLKAKNLDVNVGAVAFSDGLSNPAQIKPVTDPASQTIYSFVYPVSFSSEVGSKQILDYISNLKLSNGNLIPEGLLDSLWWTLRNGAGVSFSGEARSEFPWREQSQKIFIVITDAAVWEAGGKEISTDSELTVAGLADILRQQNAVVHVISNTLDLASFSGRLSNVGDPKALAEAMASSNLEGDFSQGTGGLWKLLPSNGRVNLLDLNLQGLIAKSVKLEFTSKKRALVPSNEQDHTLRIILDKPENDLAAEKRIQKRY